MYFGRGTYDPVATSEAQTRLQSFQGAQSISSNQYFGRDEEETAAAADGVVGGDGTLSNLEMAAKDAISRVLANPDVQNAAESIRAGAMKVSVFVHFYVFLLTNIRHSSFLTILLKCPSVNRSIYRFRFGLVVVGKYSLMW